MVALCYHRTMLITSIIKAGNYKYIARFPKPGGKGYTYIYDHSKPRKITVKDIVEGLAFVFTTAQGPQRIKVLEVDGSNVSFINEVTKNKAVMTRNLFATFANNQISEQSKTTNKKPDTKKPATKKKPTARKPSNKTEKKVPRKNAAQLIQDLIKEGSSAPLADVMAKINRARSTVLRAVNGTESLSIQIINGEKHVVNGQVKAKTPDTEKKPVQPVGKVSSSKLMLSVKQKFDAFEKNPSNESLMALINETETLKAVDHDVFALVPDRGGSPSVRRSRVRRELTASYRELGGLLSSAESRRIYELRDPSKIIKAVQIAQDLKVLKEHAIKTNKYVELADYDPDKHHGFYVDADNQDRKTHARERSKIRRLTTDKSNTFSASEVEFRSHDDAIKDIKNLYMHHDYPSPEEIVSGKNKPVFSSIRTPTEFQGAINIPHPDENVIRVYAVDADIARRMQHRKSTRKVADHKRIFKEVQKAMDEVKAKLGSISDIRKNVYAKLDRKQTEDQIVEFFGGFRPDKVDLDQLVDVLHSEKANSVHYLLTSIEDTEDRPKSTFEQKEEFIASMNIRKMQVIAKELGIRPSKVKSPPKKHEAEELKVYDLGKDNVYQKYDLEKDSMKLKELASVIDESVWGQTDIFVDTKDKKSRAFQTPLGISLHKRNISRVMWHEMGHELQTGSSGITLACAAYRAQRSTSTPQLTTIYEGTTEKGYRDEWLDHYMGKIYTNIEGNEVSAMGVDYINSKLEQFMDEDPDMFYFTLSWMSGKLGQRDRD